VSAHRAIVHITPQGSRLAELRRALAELRQLVGDASWEIPRGQVLHHAPECGTVQLVPFEVHGALPHTGGFTLCPRPPAPAIALAGSDGTGTMRDVGPALKREDVRHLEREFDCKLPASYRDFLLKSNGGRPLNWVVDRAPAGDFVVERFFALDGDVEDTLLGALDLYAPRIPKGLLPVARDPFGNLILLAIAGPSLERVFHWDHEREPEGGDEAPENLIELAPTFQRFLSLLRRPADG
jgi:hypothetical protein